MKPFTPSTAPRNGRKPGSSNKLSRQSMEILDKLLVDWAKHGAKTLKTLRIERPELYAKLALDVASRVVLNDVADAGGPMIVTVKWIDPKTSRMPHRCRPKRRIPNRSRILRSHRCQR